MYCLFVDKMKIYKKEAGYGPFKKVFSTWSWQWNCGNVFASRSNKCRFECWCLNGEETKDNSRGVLKLNRLFTEIKSSVTRFGETSPLRHNFKRFLPFLPELFSILQYCEPTLENIYYLWANSHSSKWRNIEMIR